MGLTGPLLTSARVAGRGMGRWIVYQRERFPLAAHGPIILAFSSGGVLYSAHLRGAIQLPPVSTVAVAFVVCLLFFLQLRVSDEYKDAAEDAEFRPYRPVPRGLVTIRELWRLAAAGAIIQLLLTWWLSAALIPVLTLVWVYMALMTREFWLHEWLARHPVAVIATHMMIMPLIDLYATACDWLLHDAGVMPGLRWFLIASFCNGVVIEIGRKTRAQEAEERGVATYTAMWGRPTTVATWLGAMAVTGVCAVGAARAIHAAPMVVGVLGVIFIAACAAGAAFLRQPLVARSRWIPALAGTWTIGMYLVVGVIPALLRT